MSTETGAGFDVLLSKLIQNESDSFKPITVDKPIDVDVDLGNILAIDTNPVEAGNLESEETRKDYIKSLTRDNVQILFNSLWKAPMERVNEALVVNLPPGKSEIPREKSLPKPKEETKWESFAKMKGIVKRKKGRKEWDEATQTYKFKWGYNRANDETKQWLHEVPGNADPYEDQYGKRIEKRKERVAKNEFQRLKNLERSARGDRPAPSDEFTPSLHPPTAEQLSRQIVVAKSATASAGVFQETMRAEKEVKPPRAKKRKFESNTQPIADEKSKQLEMLAKISQKGPRINTKVAMSKVEEEERLNQRVANRTKMSKKMKKKNDPLYSGKKGKMLQKAMGEDKKKGRRR